MNNYCIGIAGGSASGKTTFISELRKHFRTNELCVISLDNYYKEKNYLTIDENGRVNFDLPTSIDVEQLLNHIQALDKGQSVEFKEYTFNNPNKKPQKIIYQPALVYIIEGLFIYEIKEISSLFDLKVFIDADEDIKFQRRLKRDREERGIAEDEILYQWKNHVKPADLKYLKPYIRMADVIIQNNYHLKNSLEMMKNHIIQLVKK